MSTLAALYRMPGDAADDDDGLPAGDPRPGLEHLARIAGEQAAGYAAEGADE